MSTSIVSSETPTVRWAAIIEYPQTGSRRQMLFEDANCKYVLVSVAANASIDTHTSPRNATVNVIEGSGVLTVENKEIVLEPSVFVFIPAQARHAIKASTNMSFLLTLSA